MFLWNTAWIDSLYEAQFGSYLTFWFLKILLPNQRSLIYVIIYTVHTVIVTRNNIIVTRKPKISVFSFNEHLDRIFRYILLFKQLSFFGQALKFTVAESFSLTIWIYHNMALFIYKLNKTSKSFLYLLYNEGVGIQKLFFWLLFSGSINRSYYIALQASPQSLNFVVPIHIAVFTRIISFIIHVWKCL